ncbi:hypothetical protein Gotur_010205, partial [Gossypium turneri]
MSSMEEPKNRTCILHQLICPWHSNLRSLSLAKIPQCRHLPEWIASKMPCLTNLEMLDMGRVPQLEERCRKDIGADWHKIAHIANIKISGCYQFGWAVCLPPVRLKTAVAVRLVTVAVRLDNVAVRLETMVKCVFGFKRSCSGE